ncbi:MAG: ROK family protein [Acidobacteriaceae bacterium]
MSSFAIGVDLGGTNLRIAAVDESGKQLETITTSTEVKRGRDSVIESMCRDITALKGKYAAQYDFAGSGIGVPGIIDMETGTVVWSPNLLDWRNYPVREEIEGRLGAPVVLENDANVAALGEKWLGAGKEYSSMCMITLGTGVGGGVILDGKVWHGLNGMAGELGHITAIPEGPNCGCTNNGCLEQYASATAVKRMSLEAIASGEAPELSRAMKANPEFSAKIVYQMAMEGDVAAQRVFHKVGEALGIVISGLINLMNLPAYVLGGGMAAGWDAFAPAMFEEINKRSYVYRNTSDGDVRKRTVITRALLGGDAGLLGAAYLALHAEAKK